MKPFKFVVVLTLLLFLFSACRQRQNEPGISERAHDAENAAESTTTTASIEATPAFAPEIERSKASVSPVSAETLTPVTTGSASISGRVLDKNSHEPIVGAQVNLHPVGREDADAMHQVATDSSGGFRFDNLAADTYRIFAQKDGLRPRGGPQILTVSSDEQSSGIEFVLYAGNVLSGRVLDSNTSEPIPGVEIKVDHLTTSTAADGEYRLDGVFPGNEQSITVYLKKDGYAIEGAGYGQGRISVPIEEDAPETVRDFLMMRMTWISGQVRDSAGSAVSRAKVAVFNPFMPYLRVESRPVDATGHYKLAAQQKATVRVRATAPGFAPGFSDVVKVTDVDTTSVDIVLTAGATLKGTVVDEGGAAVAGAQVNAYYDRIPGMRNTRDEIPAVTTDNGGAFSLADLPAQSISVFASQKGYASSLVQEIKLMPEQVKDDVRLVLRKTVSLAGEVVDEESKPLKGAQITAFSSGAGESMKNARTGDDGKFRIEEISDGRFSVSAQLAEYEPEHKRDVPGGTQNLRFILKKKRIATMIGRVLDYSTRDIVPDFTVNAQGGNVSKDANSPGTFVVTNIGMRGCSVSINAHGYQDYESGWFTVPEGRQTYERSFLLGPGGGVIGRTVTAADKQPISGIAVELRTSDFYGNISKGDPAAVAVTGADGRFELKEAKPGLAAVVLRQTNPPIETFRKISVMHGEKSDLGDIEMGGEGPTIRGRLVRSPNDTGVAGETVTLREYHGHANRTGQTDAVGAFEFNELPLGNYGVLVPSYQLSAYVTLVADEKKEILLRIGNGTLRGTVLRGGQPVTADVRLARPNQYLDKNTRAGADGRFEVEGLTPGTWNVSIRPRDETQAALFEDSVEVANDQPTEHTFNLPSGRLVGSVQDSSGAPVASAQVSVIYSPRSGDFSFQRAVSRTADVQSDGSFVMSGLPPGKYAVDAIDKSRGRARAEDAVVPAEGDSAPVVLKLSGSGGTLVSVALDMTTGAPVKDAWCNLSSPGGKFSSNAQREANGTLTITDIPPGRYTAEVSAAGYSAATHDVTIEAGETVRIEDVLYEAGALVLTVADKVGNAVGNAACRVAATDPNSVEKARSGATDLSGSWICRGLMPGTYNLAVTSDRGSTSTAVFIQAHELTAQTAVVY